MWKIFENKITIEFQIIHLNLCAWNSSKIQTEDTCHSITRFYLLLTFCGSTKPIRKTDETIREKSESSKWEYIVYFYFQKNKWKFPSEFIKCNVSIWSKQSTLPSPPCTTVHLLNTPWCWYKTRSSIIKKPLNKISFESLYFIPYFTLETESRSFFLAALRSNLMKYIWRCAVWNRCS